MKPLPMPYRVPLAGTVLIEASAGTGKTHTLERLIARHILWHGRTVDEVLAVTFTNAAATDIRLRLRRFLTCCYAHDGLGADGDIEFLYSGRPADVDESTLRARLAAALADFDRAAVFTIHGFCQRLLRDHALDMAQPIPPALLLEDESALRLQVCEEFWRRCGQDPEFSDGLDAALGSPAQLLRKLPELLSAAELKPDKPAPAKPPLDAAFERLQACYRSQRQPASAALASALSQDALHKGDFKSMADIENRFAELDAFLMQPDFSELPRFPKLAFSGIREKKNKTRPDNPLFHQLDDWHAVVDDFEAYRRDCRLFLLHELRQFARKRLMEIKAERNVVGFDDIIESVYRTLENDTDGSLAGKIRSAYPAALVDEFQDTDERQWRIFERLYRGAEPASLILIGDPKQAIYGFRGGDIHTYLKVQALAEHKETLEHNFRSNPALLNAIESVFLARHAHPFPEPGIPFVKVRAGRAGETLRLQGRDVPALAFFGTGYRQETDVAQARHACARQCADAIAEWLNHAGCGNATVAHGDGSRTLIAADIAVLVSRHHEAALMQTQLQARGVASVCMRRDSLFQSYEALDILQILHALEHPASQTAQTSAINGRLLRTAMAAGGSAPDWPLMARQLAKLGPLGAFSGLLQGAGKRLLALPDGDRKMANYSQVLEHLQMRFSASEATVRGLEWLGRQISATDDADTDGLVRPNVESSRPRVRIMTLHQSKGLEFGLVFLPFSAIRNSQKPEMARYFDGSQRCLHLDVKHADAETRMRIDAEQASENLRLLYVGMTRAKFGLRCGWGWVKQLDQSPLGHLLLRNAPADGGQCADAMAGFSYSTETAHTVLLDSAIAAVDGPTLAGFERSPVPWQISSFSSLHRAQDTVAFRPADDETPMLALGPRSPFQGADFGNALHHVLEHAQPADWPSGQPGAAALALCRMALIQFGYSPQAALQGAPLIAALASNTLLVQLPEGIRLLDLPAADKRHELEFHLKLDQADGMDVLDLLHRHGYCRDRERLGFHQRLNGLLTGKIDLLYRHRDRLSILDYKSNTLADYGPDALQQSIADNEYDLQYLLYTVAVHRWLRLNRPDYVYARHFGGVRYLYARGLDAGRPGRGVFSDTPAESLITALDRCFSETEAAHG